MPPLPTRTEVLVVGAGPTGLMMGVQLARRGVHPVVIDRHAGPTTQTRALGVQARTLEIYDRLGLADRAVELGNRNAGANMWVSGRLAARAPLGDIGEDLSPFPFLLTLGQDQNERMLGQKLNELGVEVHWSTELIDLSESRESATATLKRPDGSVARLQAGWIAGCDGARSAVRDLNGIAFRGAPYEQVFFIADTRATGPMVANELNVYLWRSGFHLFFPMQGANHWRVVGILPVNLRARDDLEFDEVAPSVQAEVGSSLRFEACNWFSTYRIHHRRAERFRSRGGTGGRCFLLGDAAHIHSPVGAQGMNTGLQDAYNLAWKLALVIAGRCGERLLDSYEAERIPVADRLLATTDRAFALVVSDRWLASLVRLRLFPAALALAMRSERLRKLVFRTISQIGIRYRESVLSQTLAGLPSDGPRAGDRFPWVHLQMAAHRSPEDLFARLDDTRFNLIMVGQPATIRDQSSPACAALILVHEVPRTAQNVRLLSRARIPTPAFFLLRPDGHVGLAGRGLNIDAVGRYLSDRLDFAPSALSRDA